MVVAVSRRTASDIITRATPLIIMLTPTSVPMAHAELAVDGVFAVVQREDRDRFRLRVRDPVLRNAALSVIATFLSQVAAAASGRLTMITEQRFDFQATIRGPR